MNADSPAKGLRGILASLNCDRAYGLALLGVLALLLLPELGGEASRQVLAYQRESLAAGQWWRLLSAAIAHLDLEHASLNAMGVVLLWALFARDYSPWRWLVICLGAALAVTLGLWFLAPEVDWYVGASGALHGVMAAGTIAHLRRRDFDGWILAAFIVAKLAYEQFAGALPFSGSGTTLVDAHLYGAIGGVVMALTMPRLAGRQRA